MTRKVNITDAATGEKLREDYVPVTNMIFGFLSPSDVLKIGGTLIAVIIFFVNGQNDKKLMQDNLTAMQVTVSRLTDFRDNSDNFHTLVYDTRFKNGEPTDPSYKIRKQLNNKGD